ncbi:hypothetical protein CIT31_22725 [Mesorhizobium wenxiniae]|uniref:Uncharacterized protein n=1 Tax=Mesorhizobium wenxiniae TaxID=2014805 RepID=A0A271KE34_9HYPH|nr:hypothetical protein CIT31_22725 [Mesorhizobium wenxiniae]
MFARSDVEPLTPVRSLQRSNTKVGQRVGEATDRVASMLVRKCRNRADLGIGSDFTANGAFYVSIGWLCDTN